MGIHYTNGGGLGEEEGCGPPEVITQGGPWEARAQPL